MVYFINILLMYQNKKNPTKSYITTWVSSFVFWLEASKKLEMDMFMRWRYKSIYANISQKNIVRGRDDRNKYYEKLTSAK